MPDGEALKKKANQWCSARRLFAALLLVDARAVTPLAVILGALLLSGGHFLVLFARMTEPPRRWWVCRRVATQHMYVAGNLLDHRQPPPNQKADDRLDVERFHVGKFEALLLVTASTTEQPQECCRHYSVHQRRVKPKAQWNTSRKEASRQFGQQRNVGKDHWLPLGSTMWPARQRSENDVDDDGAVVQVGRHSRYRSDYWQIIIERTGNAN